MDAELPEIGREELRRRIEAGDGLVIVDALAPIAYARSHLPGAINLVPEWVVERAPTSIPDRDAEVVVYCLGPDCESSVDVGMRLVRLGYRNVRHYAGGKTDWVEAGLPLEGASAQRIAQRRRRS